MSLVRWNPFREFDSFFSPNYRFQNSPEMKAIESSWKPLVDVTEDANEYLIKAELPEVKKEDIHISIHNNYLTLSGERKFEKEDNKLHTIERFYGSFERSFQMPDNVREEDIEAEFNDGLLKLHLKKNEVAKNVKTRIEIK